MEVSCENEKTEKKYRDEVYCKKEYWDEVARTRCICGGTLSIHYDDCELEGENKL